MQICGKAAKFRFSSVDNTSSYQIGVLRSQIIDNELTTSQLRRGYHICENAIASAVVLATRLPFLRQSDSYFDPESPLNKL